MALFNCTGTPYVIVPGLGKYMYYLDEYTYSGSSRMTDLFLYQIFNVKDKSSLILECPNLPGIMTYAFTFASDGTFTKTSYSGGDHQIDLTNIDYFAADIEQNSSNLRPSISF